MVMVGMISGSLQADSDRVIWPGLRVGNYLAPFHIHHTNRVNSRSSLATMTAPQTLSLLILLLLLLHIAHRSGIACDLNVTLTVIICHSFPFKGTAMDRRREAKNGMC